MNWTEYQTAAQRTADTTQADEIRRELCALGLIGETGEVAELLKHALSHDEPVDRHRLMLELGDVCWYAVEALSISGAARSKVGVDTRNDGIIGLAFFASQLATALTECQDRRADSASRYDFDDLLSYVLLCVNRVSQRHGITFTDVLQGNIDKLRKRHPDGFSVEASRNRGTT